MQYEEINNLKRNFPNKGKKKQRNKLFCFFKNQFFYNLFLFFKWKNFDGPGHLQRNLHLSSPKDNRILRKIVLSKLVFFLKKGKFKRS